jgi:hypothetical protein
MYIGYHHLVSLVLGFFFLGAVKKELGHWSGKLPFLRWANNVLVALQFSAFFKFLKSL